MCNSACVLALAGGVVRTIPPGIKLGIHDVGFDSARRPLSDAVVAKARKLAHLQMQEYLRNMGVDQALFTAMVAVPNNSKRFLEREELVRFGMDRRDFGETPWQFIEGPKPAIKPAMWKTFFVRAGNEQRQYLNGSVSFDCASSQESVSYSRENVLLPTIQPRGLSRSASAGNASSSHTKSPRTTSTHVPPGWPHAGSMRSAT